VSDRRNLAILLGIVVAVALVAWLVAGRATRLPDAPLGAVPEDATAILLLDVPAVLDSTLFERLVVARGGDRGMRDIERICGASPLDAVTRVVLFASGEGPNELEHVGVIARGRFDVDSLASCVERVVEEDGGTLRRVEVDGFPGVAARGESRAVFVGSDGIVAGDEPTVRRILRTVRGEGRAAATDPVLSSLHDDIGRAKDAVLVAHLPSGWRAAIRSALRDAVDRDFEVLAGVRAIGVGASVRDGLDLEIALAFRDEADARDAHDVLRAALREATDDPRIALTPASIVLDRIDLDVRESRVRGSLALDDRRLSRVLDVVIEALDEPERPEAPPRPRAPEPEPDEIIRPTRE
jgi:hypothetical protein